MPNIFDGLSLMTDEELRYEISTLKNFNMDSINEELKRRKGSNNIKNSILGFFSGSKTEIPKEETETISLAKKVLDYKDFLMDTERKELDSMMKEIILEKLDNSNKNLTADRISMELAEIASNYLNLTETLTHAQKLDKIRTEYNKRFVISIIKSFKNLKEEFFLQTKIAIDVEYAKLTEDSKEKILKIFELDSFDSESILIAFANMTAEALLEIIEEYSNNIRSFFFSIINASISSSLSAKIPLEGFFSLSIAFYNMIVPEQQKSFNFNPFNLFRDDNKTHSELITQIVWISALFYGKNFTPSNIELPSFLMAEDLIVAEEKDETLRLLINENSILKKSYEENVFLLKYKEQESTDVSKNLSEVTRRLEAFKAEQIRNNNEAIYLKSKIPKAKNIYEKEKSEFKNSSAIFDKMQKKLLSDDNPTTLTKKDYENEKTRYIKTKKEYERAESELSKAKLNFDKKTKSINKIAQDIKNATEETEKYNKQIETLEIEILNIKEKEELVKQELEHSDVTIKDDVDARSNEIHSLWKYAYPKFVFSDKVMLMVVKIFSVRELKFLERTLTEMHNTKDITAIATDKKPLDMAYLLAFSTDGNRKFNISFKYITNENVEILEILTSQL